MANVFLIIVNMSFMGAFIIAAICIARLFLKKAPKIISYCLWVVVAFRLICPIAIESPFSLIPYSGDAVQLTVRNDPNELMGTPVIEENVSFMAALKAAYFAVEDALNGGLSGIDIETKVSDSAPDGHRRAFHSEVWIIFGSYVWSFGFAIMLIYGIVSYLLLKHKMRDAVHIENNIYESNNIKSPFVLGIFKPKIYLPLGLSEKERSYVMLHEQTHIKRRDHIVKFGAYFVLCLHWFNPLAWVAFILMGADMEMSCDERVLKEIGSDTIKDYSLSLLSLATEKRIIGGSPLAFGEGGIKERIKNVLNFKKPSRVIIVAAVALAAVLSVGFAMNRSGSLFPMTMKNVHKEPHFAGVVTGVNENTILVHVNEDEDVRRSSDIIYVSLDVKLKDSISTWYVGDEVIVYYDGMIAESYPAQIFTVYAIVMKDNSISMNSMIMLGDLRELAAKGDDLIFEDLQSFRGADASSTTGYHIMVYSVEGGYRLVARSKPNDKPDNVSLESIWESGGSGIDIRYNDVDEFIRTHPSHPAIIGEVALAIAERYAGKKLTPIDVDWWGREDEFPHNSKDPVKQALNESLDAIGQTAELFIDAEGGFIAVGRYDGTIYTYDNGTWSASTDLQDTQPPTETVLPNMIIQDISSDGLSFQFENKTDKEYTYGSGYSLYVQNNNIWEAVEPIIENWGFTDEGYTIFPKSATEPTTIDWRWLYGELPDGYYKFQKEILDWRSPGDYDTLILETDFTIPAKENKNNLGQQTAITFWVKPDEPANVIGEVAAGQWLNSYKNANMTRACSHKTGKCR